MKINGTWIVILVIIGCSQKNTDSPSPSPTTAAKPGPGAEPLPGADELVKDYPDEQELLAVADKWQATEVLGTLAAKSTVPVKGSIKEYVAAVVGTNGVGKVTGVRQVDCGSRYGCVEIRGQACPPGAPANCEGLDLTVIVDGGHAAADSVMINGKAVGDVDGAHAAIEAALDIAP